MGTYFTIGEVSKLFNLPIKTLRYYDEKGILKPTYINPETNYRYYSREQFMSIDLIKYYKLMGMSLSEIKEFIQSDSSINVMLSNMKKQSEALEEKIRELEEVKSYLKGVENSIEEIVGYEIDKVLIKHNDKRTIVKYPCKNETIKDLDMSIRNVVLHLEQRYNDVYPLLAMETSYKALNKESKLSYKYVCDFSKRDDKIYSQYEEGKEENNYGVKSELLDGEYLTIFFDDNWDNLKKYYDKLNLYIKENNINVEGNFNELWIMPRIDSKGIEKTLGYIEILIKK